MKDLSRGDARRDGNQVASNCSGGLFPEGEREKKYGEKNEQDDHWGNEGRYPILFSFTSYSSILKKKNKQNNSSSQTYLKKYQQQLHAGCVPSREDLVRKKRRHLQ